MAFYSRTGIDEYALPTCYRVYSHDCHKVSTRPALVRKTYQGEWSQFPDGEHGDQQLVNPVPELQHCGQHSDPPNTSESQVRATNTTRIYTTSHQPILKFPNSATYPELQIVSPPTSVAV